MKIILTLLQTIVDLEYLDVSISVKSHYEAQISDTIIYDMLNNSVIYNV